MIMLRVVAFIFLSLLLGLACPQTPPLWCGGATCPPQAGPVVVGEVWEFAADEGKPFLLTAASARIRYGSASSDRWTTGVIPWPAGSTAICSNLMFGDPAVGAAKQCLLLAQTWAPLPAPVALAPGLLGEYFLSNPSLLGVAGISRNDNVIDFALGGPFFGGPTDNFSIRWTGYITAPTTAPYIFTISSDDGARLWINNVLVHDNWIQQGVRPIETAPVALVAGTSVAIRLEYFEALGASSIKLEWRPDVPGSIDQVVPSTALRAGTPFALASSPPPCWPSKAFGVPLPGTTGTELKFGALENVGAWYGWRCGEGVKYGKLITKDYKGPGFADIVREAFGYPDLTSAVAAMWAKYDASCTAIALDIPACQAGLQKLHDAAATALTPSPSPPPPPPPPPLMWKVAPNVLSTTTPPTRPVYGFAEGRRKAITATRAIVGQPCNGAIAQVIEGSVAYMAFGPTFNPAEVAICRQ